MVSTRGRRSFRAKAEPAVRTSAKESDPKAESLGSEALPVDGDSNIPDPKVEDGDTIGSRLRRKRRLDEPIESPAAKRRSLPQGDDTALRENGVEATSKRGGGGTEGSATGKSRGSKSRGRGQAYASPANVRSTRKSVGTIREWEGDEDAKSLSARKHRGSGRFGRGRARPRRDRSMSRSSEIGEVINVADTRTMSTRQQVAQENSRAAETTPKTRRSAAATATTTPVKEPTPAEEESEPVPEPEPVAVEELPEPSPEAPAPPPPPPPPAHKKVEVEVQQPNKTWAASTLIKIMDYRAEANDEEDEDEEEDEEAGDEQSKLAPSASLALRVEALPVLQELSEQLLHAYATMSLEDITHHIVDRNTEDGKAYARLKKLFDDTKRVYGARQHFIGQSPTPLGREALDIFRKANLATFVTSCYGSQDVGFYQLNQNFFEVFAPDGNRLLRPQFSILLAIKTQAVISAFHADEVSVSETLDEMFPLDMEERLLQSRKSLAPSENDFLRQMRGRREEIRRVCQLRLGVEDKRRHLRETYPWNEFLWQLGEHISQNFESLVGKALRDLGPFHQSPLSISPARLQVQRQQLATDLPSPRAHRKRGASGSQQIAPPPYKTRPRRSRRSQNKAAVSNKSAAAQQSQNTAESPSSATAPVAANHELHDASVQQAPSEEPHSSVGPERVNGSASKSEHEPWSPHPNSQQPTHSPTTSQSDPHRDQASRNSQPPSSHYQYYPGPPPGPPHMPGPSPMHNFGPYGPPPPPPQHGTPPGNQHMQGYWYRPPPFRFSGPPGPMLDNTGRRVKTSHDPPSPSDDEDGPPEVPHSLPQRPPPPPFAGYGPPLDPRFSSYSHPSGPPGPPRPPSVPASPYPHRSPPEEPPHPQPPPPVAPHGEPPPGFMDPYAVLRSIPHFQQSKPTLFLYEDARAFANAHGSLRSKPGKESQRKAWSPEEELALMAGLDTVKGPHWGAILAMYGSGGSINEALRSRSQPQLKDKARNLKLFFMKNAVQVPYYLQYVTGDIKRPSFPGHYGEGSPVGTHPLGPTPRQSTSPSVPDRRESEDGKHRHSMDYPPPHQTAEHENSGPPEHGPLPPPQGQAGGPPPSPPPSYGSRHPSYAARPHFAGLLPPPPPPPPDHARHAQSPYPGPGPQHSPPPHHGPLPPPNYGQGPPPYQDGAPPASLRHGSAQPHLGKDSFSSPRERRGSLPSPHDPPTGAYGSPIVGSYSRPFPPPPTSRRSPPAFGSGYALPPPGHPGHNAPPHHRDGLPNGSSQLPSPLATALPLPADRRPPLSGGGRGPSNGPHSVGPPSNAESLSSSAGPPPAHASPFAQPSAHGSAQASPVVTAGRQLPPLTPSHASPRQVDGGSLPSPRHVDASSGFSPRQLNKTSGLLSQSGLGSATQLSPIIGRVREGNELPLHAKNSPEGRGQEGRAESKVGPSDVPSTADSAGANENAEDGSSKERSVFGGILNTITGPGVASSGDDTNGENERVVEEKTDTNGATATNQINKKNEHAGKRKSSEKGQENSEPSKPVEDAEQEKGDAEKVNGDGGTESEKADTPKPASSGWAAVNG